MNDNKLLLIAIILVIFSTAFLYLLASSLPINLREAVERGGLLENTTIGSFSYTIRGNVVTITHKEGEETPEIVTDFNGTIEKISGDGDPSLIWLLLVDKDMFLIKLIILLTFPLSWYAFIPDLFYFKKRGNYLFLTLISIYTLISFIFPLEGRMSSDGAIFAFSGPFLSLFGPAGLYTIDKIRNNYSTLYDIEPKYDPLAEFVIAVFSLPLPLLVFHLLKTEIMGLLLLTLLLIAIPASLLLLFEIIDYYCHSVILSALSLVMLFTFLLPAAYLAIPSLLGGEVGALLWHRWLKPRRIILIKRTVSEKKGKKIVHFIISDLSESDWREAVEHEMNIATPKEHNRLEEEVKSRKKTVNERCP